MASLKATLHFKGWRPEPIPTPPTSPSRNACPCCGVALAERTPPSKRVLEESDRGGGEDDLLTLVVDSFEAIRTLFLFRSAWGRCWAGGWRRGTSSWRSWEPGTLGWRGWWRTRRRASSLQSSTSKGGRRCPKNSVGEKIESLWLNRVLGLSVLMVVFFISFICFI